MSGYWPHSFFLRVCEPRFCLGQHAKKEHGWFQVILISHLVNSVSFWNVRIFRRFASGWSINKQKYWGTCLLLHYFVGLSWLECRFQQKSQNNRPMQKWLPLNYSLVHIQNSLTNLVWDNKFFTVFVSKTSLVRLFFKYKQKNIIKAAIFA